LGLTGGLRLLQLEGLEFLGCGGGRWFVGAAVEGGGGRCMFGGGEELSGGRRGGGERERWASGSGEVGDVLEKRGRTETRRGRLIGIHCTLLFLLLSIPNWEKTTRITLPLLLNFEFQNLLLTVCFAFCTYAFFLYSMVHV